MMFSSDLEQLMMFSSDLEQTMMFSSDLEQNRRRHKTTLRVLVVLQSVEVFPLGVDHIHHTWDFRRSVSMTGKSVVGTQDRQVGGRYAGPAGRWSVRRATSVRAKQECGRY
eukprot:4816827-Prymnesium_polylepis.1